MPNSWGGGVQDLTGIDHRGKTHAQHRRHELPADGDERRRRVGSGGQHELLAIRRTGYAGWRYRGGTCVHGLLGAARIGMRGGDLIRVVDVGVVVTLLVLGGEQLHLLVEVLRILVV